MLYTVAEISDMLGFSKVTIYNKLNSLKTDLKGCIKVRKGITHIDSKGLSIIRKDLGLINDEDTLNNDDNIKDLNIDNTIGIDDFKDINYLVETLKETIEIGQENYINSLLEQIEMLKLEVNKKDEQINTTLRLLENSQILIREGKEKVLQLESQDQKERKSFFSWFKN